VQSSGHAVDMGCEGPIRVVGTDRKVGAQCHRPKSLSRKSIHDSNRLRLGPGGHPSDQIPCPLALLPAAGLDIDGLARRMPSES